MRVRQPKHLAYLLACPLFGACLLTLVLTGENNLSFIETSALDASNVELAFQNILTGTSSNAFPFPSPPPLTRIPHPDRGKQRDTYEIFFFQRYIASSPAKPLTRVTLARIPSVTANLWSSPIQPTPIRRRVAAVKRPFFCYSNLIHNCNHDLWRGFLWSGIWLALHGDVFLWRYLRPGCCTCTNSSQRGCWYLRGTGGFAYNYYERMYTS